MNNNYVEQKSLVPIIPKSQFDTVATEFLTEYCPEALLNPMPVPIVEIGHSFVKITAGKLAMKKGLLRNEKGA